MSIIAKEEKLFSLTYGIEVDILVEIRLSSYRISVENLDAMKRVP